MNLQEELALLLADTHDQPRDVGGGLEYVINSPDREVARWLLVAEECLRQMAWARINGTIDLDWARKHNSRVMFVGGPAKNMTDISLTGDLALAPKDWKPSWKPQ